jgi:hypothetical protein
MIAKTHSYPDKWLLRSTIFIAAWLLLVAVSNVVHWSMIRLGASWARPWKAFLFESAIQYVPICVLAAIGVNYFYRPTVKADEYGLSIPVGIFASRRYRWSEIAYVQAVRASKRRRLSLRFWIWVSDRRRLPISFDEGISDLPDLLARIDQKHVEYSFPLHYRVYESCNTRVPEPKPLPRGPVIDTLSSLLMEPPAAQRRAPGV